MLVLSRKEGQRLVIGDRVVVKVLEVTGGRIRLGIEAPREVSIRRAELPPVACGRSSGLGAAPNEPALLAECA
jgi:carbon storage regulator